MNGPMATSASSPFHSQLRTLVGGPQVAFMRPTVIGRIHSITSSALASSGSGIVSPSALAVLRLMINSTFVACWTGMSAGFSPLKSGRRRPPFCR